MGAIINAKSNGISAPEPHFQIGRVFSMKCTMDWADKMLIRNKQCLPFGYPAKIVTTF
jgi:hypothetical protein